MNTEDPFNKGLELARKGDYAGALAFLQRSLVLAGEHADTYRLMGKVHLRLGESAQARDCWRKALTLDPNDSGAEACLAVLQRFQANRAKVQAIVLLAAISVLSAGLWLQWSSLRGIRQSIDRLGASIPQWPAPASQTGPGPVPAQAAPAPPPAFESEKGTASGERAAAAGHPAATSFQERYREALAEAMSGDIQTARGLLEPLAGEEHAGQPLAGNVHFWLGRCLYELGEIQPALKEFNLVVEQYPGSPKVGDALLDIGRCWLRLGHRDRAEQAWQKLLSDNYDPRLQEVARRILRRLSTRQELGHSGLASTWESRVSPDGAGDQRSLTLSVVGPPAPRCWPIFGAASRIIAPAGCGIPCPGNCCFPDRKRKGVTEGATGL